MKGGKSPLKLKTRQSGYTIVEVMIVLAVSGVMFAIAANFISGRQAKAAFTQGANEMATRIQSTVDQVTDGRYSDIKLACTTTGVDGLDDVSVPGVGAGTNQGKNSSCVFMGKMMGFPADNTQYQTFVLAGNRKATDLLEEGKHKVVVGLTTDEAIPHGLEVRDMRLSGGSNTEIRSLGFVRDALDGGKVTPVYAAGASASSVNGALSRLASSDSAVLCITDGTRFGKIIIGSSGAGLRVKTELGLTGC